MKKKLVLLAVVLALGRWSPVMAQTGSHSGLTVSPPISDGRTTAQPATASNESTVANSVTKTISISVSPLSRQDNEEGFLSGEVVPYYNSIISPPTVPFFLSHLLSSLYDSSYTATDLIQNNTKVQSKLSLFIALQNEIVIQQNDKIIHLLTTIANKK